jgi:hypothetical protein
MAKKCNIPGPGCWAFSSQFRQRGPYATDRSISSIGALLPIALMRVQTFRSKFAIE